jgi:large subunit ribosomal protein L27e
MSLVYKQGRIVLILNGRFSGCKAVVMNKDHSSIKQKASNFDSVFLLGISKSPCKITKKMNSEKIVRKNKIKIFLKEMNKNHILPTRYNIDFGEENNQKVTKIITEHIENKNNNHSCVKRLSLDNHNCFIKNILFDKYLTKKYKWFFQKLKF